MEEKKQSPELSKYQEILEACKIFAMNCEKPNDVVNATIKALNSEIRKLNDRLGYLRSANNAPRCSETDAKNLKEALGLVNNVDSQKIIEYSIEFPETEPGEKPIYLYNCCSGYFMNLLKVALEHSDGKHYNVLFVNPLFLNSAYDQALILFEYYKIVLLPLVRHIPKSERHEGELLAGINETDITKQLFISQSAQFEKAFINTLKTFFSSDKIKTVYFPCNELPDSLENSLASASLNSHLDIIRQIASDFGAKEAIKIFFLAFEYSLKNGRVQLTPNGTELLGDFFEGEKFTEELTLVLKLVCPNSYHAANICVR